MTTAELEEMRHFHAEIEEYERTHPIDEAREAAEDAEDRKMNERFPNEHVAYRDSWDGQHLTRKILAHGRHVGDLRDQLELTDDEWLGVSVAYTFHPGEALCTRLLTGQIQVRDATPSS